MEVMNYPSGRSWGRTAEFCRLQQARGRSGTTARGARVPGWTPSGCSYRWSQQRRGTWLRHSTLMLTVSINIDRQEPVWSERMSISFNVFCDRGKLLGKAVLVWDLGNGSLSLQFMSTLCQSSLSPPRSWFHHDFPRICGVGSLTVYSKPQFFAFTAQANSDSVYLC